MKYMHGVTLLELMIVVVIIGILTAIAYPNYQQFVARAKRTEARALLLEIAINQERFYLQNNTYGSMADLQYDDPQITPSEAYSVTWRPYRANRPPWPRLPNSPEAARRNPWDPELASFSQSVQPVEYGIR